MIVTVSAPAPAPTLDVTVSTVDIKTVQFDWNAISGASFYKLLVNPDGASGFSLQTDNITANSTSFTLPIHFTDWVNATYQVEAYDGSGLITSSSAFSITSEMLNVVGYLRAGNAGINDLFGWFASLFADGQTLAVGAISEDGNSRGINGADDNVTNDAGAVYVFAFESSAWLQKSYIKANIFNPTNSQFFGRAVSLSADGQTLIVGSNGDEGPLLSTPGSGALFVYLLNVYIVTDE